MLKPVVFNFFLDAVITVALSQNRVSGMKMHFSLGLEL